MNIELNFYKGKKVLVTGHTGFKGAWLCTLLKYLGADVTGYALPLKTEQQLFKIAGVEDGMDSVLGDIRDLDHLQKVFTEARPEIVFHLAAQPIVRESYERPVYTYETNVMGTVNVLECVRKNDCIKSVVNVTTDKVYENKEWEWGYRENDRLNGYDVYSNSKSCSELVTDSYRKSFFLDREVAVSTARAGNVIGGGDFARDRIIPDCVRAVLQDKRILIRNPNSIRPYQHVLEPLCAYLLIARKQYDKKANQGNYNIGPEEKDCVSTGQLVELFIKKWGEQAAWENVSDRGPHEANYLKLDCSRIKQRLNWTTTYGIEKAVELVVEWTKEWRREASVKACMEEQIKQYLKAEREV